MPCDQDRRPTGPRKPRWLLGSVPVASRVLPGEARWCRPRTPVPDSHHDERPKRLPSGMWLIAVVLWSNARLRPRGELHGAWRSPMASHAPRPAIGAMSVQAGAYWGRSRPEQSVDARLCLPSHARARAQTQHQSMMDFRARVAHPRVTVAVLKGPGSEPGVSPIFPDQPPPCLSNVGPYTHTPPVRGCCSPSGTPSSERSSNGPRVRRRPSMGLIAGAYHPPPSCGPGESSSWRRCGRGRTC
jgi:hypothetical protein